MHIGGLLSFEQQGATSVLVSKTEARLSLPSGTIAGRWIFDQASKGNLICQGTIAEMCDVLSLGISNLFYILNPEVVVIGGGISSQEAVLRPLLEDGLPAICPPIRKQISFPSPPEKSCRHGWGLPGIPGVKLFVFQFKAPGLFFQTRLRRPQKAAAQLPPAPNGRAIRLRLPGRLFGREIG